MVFHESLNPERKFSFAIPLVFIAILGGTTGVVSLATVLSPEASYAVSARSQLAQAPAPVNDPASTDPNDGICGREYTKCKSNPKMTENRCDLLWKACIENKCQKIDTKTIDQCPKDSDCISSCTDLVEANGALKQCCSVIKHGNTCRVATEGAPENSCNPEKTKLPNGGSGTGENITPADLEDTQRGIDMTKSRIAAMEEEYRKATQGLTSWTPVKEDQLNGLSSNLQMQENELARQQDAYDQILKSGGSPTKLTETDDGVGAYNVPLDKSLGDNPVRLTPEQQTAADYAKLADAFGPQDTFGPAATPEELRKAELENTIRSDQAAWDAANRQAALEETIRSDQAAWAGANNQAALEETIRSDQAAWAEANNQAALDRDARIQELKNAEAGANAGTNDFSPAQRKELDELTGRNAPADPTMDWYNSLSDKDKKALHDNYGEDIRAAHADKLATDAGAQGGGSAPKPEEKAVNVPLPKPRPEQAPDPKNDPLAKSEQSKGAPDPSKPYYVQRGDQWCDQFGSCKDAKKFTPAPGQGGPPAAKTPTGGGGAPDGNGDKTNNQGGSGSGLGSALSSMLQGLMKALGAPQPPPAAPSQPCSTDPNIYAQQQQQYQQQLQQYNYQMQQQQYQQQVNQFYAERNGTTPPPVQPLPPQPSACTPSTGSQCREQPQQPAASSCTGGWRPVYNGSCITNWNCPNTGDAPTATLSCEPDLADVGQTLALTYNCSSGIASSSAFKVTTQPGGSATTTVKAPPQGTNTATYTLACTDNGKTTGAQCSVKVNRPNIFLVTNPRTVAPGEISLISWLTTGMDSCIISSPDQPDFTLRNSSNTSVTGAATTSPITSSAMFQLDCITKGGIDRQATTTVSVEE